MKLLKSVIGPILFLILILLFSKFIISIEFGPINVLNQQFNSFDLKDVYFNSLKAEANCDPDILVIGTDNLKDRFEIANLIDTLAEMEASAIGVDLFFAAKKPNDHHLLSILKKHRKIIVLGATINNNSVQTSYFNQLASLNNGIVAFDDAHESFPNAPIRAIKNTYPKTKLSSFSLKILELNLKHKNLTVNQELKSTDEILINYPLKQPLIIRSSDTSLMSPDFIRGKIILLGDLENVSDQFKTPFYNSPSNEQLSKMTNLPGVVIHALTLESIKNNDYFKSYAWLNKLIFLTFSLAIFLVLGKIHRDLNESYDLWARLFQLFASIILLIIYYSVLHYWHYDLDFGMLFVTLVLASDSIEIYSSIKFHLSKYKIARKGNKKVQSKNTNEINS